MPGDMLSGLLNESLTLDPDATSTFFGNDPVRAAADRSSSVDAIMHAINTGQPPTQVTSPSYGPIGELLQKMGLRSRFKAPSARLGDQIGIAQKEYAGEQQQGQEEFLKTLQAQGTEFGTESARAAATTLGHPELGAAFPKDIKGKGELVQSSQDLQLQRALMSNDINEQKLGIQQQTAMIREALLSGQIDRAQQLVQLSHARQDLAESRFADAPTSKVSDALLQSLDRQEESAQRAWDNYLAGGVGTEDDATSQRYQKRIDEIGKRRIKLLSGYGSYKDPQSVATSVYGPDTDEQPTPKPGASKVKPAAKGTFD